MKPDITKLFRYCIVVFITFCYGISQAATMPHQAKDKTLGTVNCANSTCHGSITPWQESNVLQNEYTTWVRLDRHTQTYDVLLNEESKQIAKNLGLKEPAHEAKICLDCHAHNPPAAMRGERHVLSEGVGCEGCHGPSERWIKPHTLKDNTHRDNLMNGMYPTSNNVDHAKLCLSCHFGDASRFVTHRIMGAGHPRISFELETFSALQPSHFKADKDWHERKGSYNPIKLWAIGQVVASQQLLDAFTDPKLGRDGLFPELVLFDCHACHHPMSAQKWSPRLGIGPGRVRLNDSNLLMLRAIAKVIDSKGSDALSKRITQLHHAVSSSENPSVSYESARKLSNSLDAYYGAIERQPFDLAQLKQVYLALIEEASRNEYSDYAGAEQAYMAVSDLSLSISKLGGFKNPSLVNRHLANIRKSLIDDETFDPEVFAKKLSDLKFAITQSR